MVNRAALLIRLKQPFVHWINTADPADARDPISLEEVNEDSTIYLIKEDEPDHLDQWLQLNHRQLLESELEDWHRNKELWPEISLEMFFEWCEVECHTVIVDTVGGIIEDDGM